MSSNTPRPPRPGNGPKRPSSGGAAGSRKRSTSAAGGLPFGRKSAAKKGEAKKPKEKLTRKQWLLKGLKWATISGLVFVVLLVSVFYFAYRATKIPDPNTAFQAQTTKVYYAGGKSEVGSFATQNRESVPLADISKYMQEAVVAAEDRTFWTNNGIDIKGIVRAAFSNARGNATQGASTITQQYVKLLYLSQERTLKRKLKEAILSLKIQQQQSKSQILEGYLNTIYFGRGAYGVQAAAQAFFNVNAKQLNPSQSAMLAAVLNSPNSYSPDAGDAARARLLARYKYVVDGMETTGKLSSDVAAKIHDRLPTFAKQRTSNLYGGQKGFMLDMVKSELLKLGFNENDILAGGLRVTTTFTKKAMNAAKAGIDEVKPKGLSQLHAAAASVDVKTGALLGFYAGQDYLKSQLNWAKIGDSPGSSFKPFALAAGLKAGFSLKDTFQGSSPYRFPSGLEVKNEGQGDGHSYGAKIDLIKATQESVNTAYIDLTASIPHGPQAVLDMAVKMGIPADSPGLSPDATIALGSATVSPINMANAYGTIADGGLAKQVYVISKVTRASDGEVLYTAKHETTRAISQDIAADVSYALQQTVQGGTGENAKAINRPAAGKTGTATKTGGDVISSWFVGYTPQVSTAVMYVRGDGRKTLEGYLNPFYGATYPTKTWAAIMNGVMDGLPTEQFPPRANVDGNAPDSGHSPLPPKPTKKPTKKPTNLPTNVPTAPITPTAPSTPTAPPTPTNPATPTGTPCGIFGCNPTPERRR